MGIVFAIVNVEIVCVLGCLDRRKTRLEMPYQNICFLYSISLGTGQKTWLTSLSFCNPDHNMPCTDRQWAHSRSKMMINGLNYGKESHWRLGCGCTGNCSFAIPLCLWAKLLKLQAEAYFWNISNTQTLHSLEFFASITVSKDSCKSVAPVIRNFLLS